MTRALTAELLKLRTTRTFWGLAGATLALVMLAVVLPLALDSGVFDESDVRSLLSSAGGAGLMMLILGAVFSAGEYRHGTIAWTLLVTPVRLLVALLRKQVAAVVRVLVFPFVVDPALVALVDGYDRFSLSGLAASITGTPEEDFGGGGLLPFWAATLAWSAYTFVLVGAAALLTSRRDI